MELSDVIVRDATVSDLPRLVELISLGSLSPSSENLDEMALYEAVLQEINAQGSAVLVAEVNQEIVGVLQMVVFRHLQRNGGLCAEFESIHVHPEKRSLGIGGVLVEAAVTRANALGCYRVQLTSNLERPDAHRFYERHGFNPSHKGFKRVL